MAQGTGRDSDKFMLRLPEGMRDRLKNAADEAGRSMNAEIVARLGWTLEGNLSDLSAEGFGAYMKLLSAAVETNMQLMFGIRDVMPGLEKYMLSKGIDRQQAIQEILGDWLSSHGYAEQKKYD